MALDTQSSERLLRFCSKLPGFPGDATAAADEARFTLACFTARSREIEAEMQQSASNAQGLAMLRCESEALASAQRVIHELWLRRYGGVLASN